MSQVAQTAQTSHHVLVGATIGGGALEWITLNTSLITAFAVVATALSSMALGVWNARINSERNTINRRDVTQAIVDKLRAGGKDKDYIDDFLETIRS
jgi:hypothetical protein